MTWKTFGFAALALSSVVLSTRTAAADVSEPSPAFVLLPASPGIATAAGSLVTAVGSAATHADGEPSTGWSIASLVTGSLSVTSGAIYTGVVADGNAEPGLFTALAASNFALGASNIVLGVVGLTADVSPTTVGLLPRVSVDGEGRRMAVVSGAF